MKTFLKGITVSSKVIFTIALSLASLFIYIFVAYLVAGHEVISGGALGSDSWAFITKLKLLSDYFPNYPFWNYLEGGGVSLTYSYPILTHTIIVATSKLFSITLPEALKFWVFASVVIFALGIFIYVWVRLKIAVVAFLAGLFYVISPIAWMWPFEWGFIGEHIAGMFFPYTILFFDLFLLGVFENDTSFKTRLYLFLTVILLGLSALGHPFVFTGALVFMLVYGFIVAAIRRKEKVAHIVRFLVTFAGVFTLTLLLFGFWLLPYYRYTGLANSSSNVVSNEPPRWTDEYDRNDLTLAHLFSFDPPRRYEKNDYFAKFREAQEGDSIFGTDVLTKGYIFRNLSFPLAVSLLFLISIPTSLILWKRKFPILLLTAVILILISVSVQFIFFVHTLSFYISKLPFIGSPVAAVLGWIGGWRGNLFAARLMVPMGAAFGAYGIFAAITYPLKFMDKNVVFNASKSLILTFLALIFAGSVVYNFRYKPALLPAYIAYGKEVSFLTRAKYLRNWWNEKRLDDNCSHPEISDRFLCNQELFNYHFDASRVIESCNLAQASVCSQPFSDQDVLAWVKACDSGVEPFASFGLCAASSEISAVLLEDLSLEKIKYKIGEFRQGEFYFGPKEFHDTFDRIPDDPFIRYDTSPMVALFSMAGPYFKKTPQMTVYINSASLIHRMWGYQTSNFYPPNEKVYADPAALPEIAQWFGIKYMMSHPSDPLWKLDEAGFKKLPDSLIYEFSEAEPLAALAKKPTILVIGDSQKGTYELVFRKANFGFISYNEAMLVNGGEYVDQYSLDELKRFNVLFLHGYKYKSKVKAWRLLDDYVKGGGRLYIDTGWQFVSADWDVGETADFFPTTALSWTDFGKTSDYSLHEGLINTEDVDTGGFEPLIWQDSPWGVSSGDALRSWAKPILTVQGKPLVAGGQYGKGKVVWSGMNILGHIRVFDSRDSETIFASRLIDWLLDGAQVQNFVFRQDFDAKRPNPDRIEFTFKTSIDGPLSLYFKEAAHPFWKAEVLRDSKRREEPEIQKAGPGFMYLRLSDINAGDRVNLFIQKPLKHYIYDLISVTALLGLLAFVVYPRPFHIKFPRRLKALIFKEKLSWLSGEEENY